jgi:hypothetical protein
VRTVARRQGNQSETRDFDQQRRNAKDFVFAIYTPKIFSILCVCRRRHIGVGICTGASTHKHGRGFQGSSRRTHTDRKYFGCVSRKCKRFCIWSFQMQNLLDFDSLDKIFSIPSFHFVAPDQNPLDFIGFLVGGSCRTRH